jgi:hypothetical protein
VEGLEQAAQRVVRGWRQRERGGEAATEASLHQAPRQAVSDVEAHAAQPPSGRGGGGGGRVKVAGDKGAGEAYSSASQIVPFEAIAVEQLLARGDVPRRHCEHAHALAPRLGSPQRHHRYVGRAPLGRGQVLVRGCAQAPEVDTRRREHPRRGCPWAEAWRVETGC